MNIILTIIAFLYGITGIIAIIGYIPTIRDLRKKIQSANINSYIIWTFSNLATFLYVVLIVPDLLLEIITGLNLLFCAIVLFLALELKHKK